jgi:AraC-like DNA-binding protein
MIVKEVLKQLGLHFVVVDLGEVEIMENILEHQRQQLKVKLLEAGLELMDDKKSVLIEKIKTAIHEMIHQPETEMKVNFSAYLSDNLKYEYAYLSNLFSEVQGSTIEQYIILLKVEKIKEMIIYGEFSITEISKMMNYSSLAHLSSQFKKVTGLSPSHFKSLKEKRTLHVGDTTEK